MRVPFSVGYGQFVMEESYLRGPMLGASIRGKVDFKMRRVNLGGTYVPLQGLNGALCEIPMFGPIIAGPKCEGLSGMTFAIQGPMDQPQVIVNPLSMLAPGIFRDIFQMTQPRPEGAAPRRGAEPDSGDDSVRTSSTTRRRPRPADADAGHDDRLRHRRRLVVADDRAQEEAIGGQVEPSSTELQTGFRSTCFFLPSDSLMTPSATSRRA